MIDGHGRALRYEPIGHCSMAEIANGAATNKAPQLPARSRCLTVPDSREVGGDYFASVINQVPAQPIIAPIGGAYSRTDGKPATGRKGRST